MTNFNKTTIPQLANQFIRIFLIIRYELVFNLFQKVYFADTDTTKNADTCRYRYFDIALIFNLTFCINKILNT